MSASQSDDVGNRSAVAVSSRFKLGAEGRALLREGMSIPEFANALLDQGQQQDAVRLVAHALPPREAVWWACQCARQVPEASTATEEVAAINVAEKWVAEMTDETRRTALPAANEAGAGTAAGCAALAVFYSGESLAVPDAAPVPPTPYQTAQLVTGSVVISALHPDPTKGPAKYRTFVDQGIELFETLGRQSA